MILDFHHIFLMVSNGVLVGVIVANICIVAKSLRERRKTKKIVAELEQFNRDKFPMMISALERLSHVVCPLCAVAEGEGEIKNEDGEKLNPEAEANGEHVIYVAGRQGTAACRAADIRNDARKLFAEAFGESGGLTIVGMKGANGQHSD